MPRPRKVLARFTGNGAEYHATTVEYFCPKYFGSVDHTIQQLEARFSSEDLHTYSFLESVLVSTELPDDAEVVLGSYPEVNVAYLRSELPIFHRHAKSRLGSVAQVVAYAS